MAILYQLVLTWFVPVLLVPLSYRLFQNHWLSPSINSSVFSNLLIGGLILYGILSMVLPNFGLLLLTVLLLSVAAPGLLADNSRTDSRLFDGRLPVDRFLLYFGLILLLAVIFRTYRLGQFGYLLDEPWHFKTAVGYLRTGEFQFWDFYDASTGKSYRRAWLYTWQVAGALRWFGESLTIGRWVSVLWGLLLFLPVVAYSWLLKLNRRQRLLVYLLTAISPYLVLSSRWVRHYSMYTTLYLSALVLIVLTLRARSRNPWLFGTLAIINYGLLLHLHPAPSLLLAAAVVVYFTVRAFRDSNPENRNILIAIIVPVSLLLAGVGLELLSPEGSGPLSGLVSRLRAELSGPTGLNVLYGYYATSLSIGAGLGGLITGTMIVTIRNRREGFFVTQLLVPLVALIFLDRSVPSVRYAGHLIPVAIPLIVLVGTRLIGSTTVDAPFAKIALVLVLIGVPAARFHHQLGRIWNGHQDYVSFPGDDAQHYKHLEAVLKERVQNGGRVLLLDLPSYHAMRLRKRGVKTVHRSFFEDRITRGELRRTTCGKDGLWIVSTYAYRDPTDPAVETFLEENFRPVPVSTIHGINLYHRKENSPACR